MVSILDRLTDKQGDTTKSTTWYKNAISSIGQKITASKLMAQGKLSARPNIGLLNLFFYDPKYKVKEAVISYLRASIIRGDIKPGEILHESDMQEKFGVSRPPIREALVQLTQEGLIRTFPKKGSVVTEINKQHLKQSLFVRSNLEASNMELLLQNIEATGLLELEESNKEQYELLQNENFPALYDSMDKFHYILFGLNNLSRVWELIRREKISLDRLHALNMTLDSLTIPKLGHFERMNLMYNQHVQIVEGLREKDSIKCLSIIRSHANIDFESADNPSKVDAIDTSERSSESVR
jgi:DNA-binding GntR family transcriptional regulator